MPEQRELSLQKLHTRSQKKGESYSALAADLQRLVMKSYPDTVGHITNEKMAVDYFVNAVSNTKVRRKLRQKHPKEMSLAIKEARQIEVDLETETMMVKRSDRAHVTTDESRFDNLQEQICQIQSEMKSKKNDRPSNEEKKKDVKFKGKGRGPPTCFNCKHVGHIRKWCPYLMGNNTDPVPPMSKTGKTDTKVDTQENSRG